MDLKDKRLLILGGNPLSIEIVKAAQKMGVYTIVTDWYDTKRSPAKLVADEYWNEEIFKPERISQLIKERHIDGVITGFTDSYLLQYCTICELSGLPCYSTRAIFEKTLNKSEFKKLCRENEIPVVPDFDLEEFNPDIISKDNIILIKPVDNSGSRGIVTCDDSKQFKKCLDYALSFSEKKQVVIEKYINMDSFSVSYTIQDGVISMSTMNDRVVHRVAGAGAVTNGGIYPSKYIDSYMKKMDMKVRAMYKNLGVKNGVLFIQGFTNGYSYYFYEMGYRLSGGCHFLYTENQNNSSSASQLVHFALTGKMADYKIIERDDPKFHDLCFQWNILGKEGVISRIEGFDTISNLPEVIHSTINKHVGSRIGKDGTTMQKIAGFHAIVNNLEQMKRLVQYMYDHFQVFDENGRNMVMDTVYELDNMLSDNQLYSYYAKDSDFIRSK